MVSRTRTTTCPSYRHNIFISKGVTINHRWSVTDLTHTNVRFLLLHIQTNLLNSIKQLSGPTDRTRHVRGQPGVNTPGVETVPTVWNQFNNLSFLKLAQANGAVFNHHLELHGHTVGHKREWFHGGGIETLVVVWFRRWVSAGANIGGGRRRWRRRRVLGGEAADVNGEEAHKEEGAEENENSQGHGGVEWCGGSEWSIYGGGGAIDGLGIGISWGRVWWVSAAYCIWVYLEQPSIQNGTVHCD